MALATTAEPDLKTAAKVDQNPDVVEVLAKHHAMTSYCFKADKGYGNVSLVWNIGGGGEPTAVKAAASSEASPQVIACLIDRVQRLRFPKSPNQRAQHDFIVGSLDPDIIRRIVREHAGQIKYCYEKELIRTPGIAGKVIMKWVINGEGQVTQAMATETLLNNPAVESCLATRIKTWVFPKPRGGGTVVVNYPFVFKSGI